MPVFEERAESKTFDGEGEEVRASLKDPGWKFATALSSSTFLFDGEVLQLMADGVEESLR